MYQKYTNEVNAIRRVSALLILILMFACLTAPVRASAATLSSKAGAVTTSSGKLNVRSKPSSASSVVAQVQKGSYLTLISKSGSWWLVEYAKGKQGYCHADYITVVQGSPVTVAISSGSLNVRGGPGTGYSKTASLAKGEVVLLLSTSGDWSRVLYHGTKTGYVSSRYLSGYLSAVSVKVPGFKQNDSRWADVLIGESGKTIKEIGCATTAIAMMESKRTGTTVYPDAMSRQLSYTPSGNVYWPEHYSVVTGQSGYLSGIYNKLKQGKPVLFGAVNSYGAQHWVVITGFTGGSTLTASGFTIQDPGTWSRTNLQQFLNAYPTFYKYFHY